MPCSPPTPPSSEAAATHSQRRSIWGIKVARSQPDMGQEKTELLHGLVLTSLLGSGHVKWLCFRLWQINEMEAIHLIRFSPQNGENWFRHSKGELSRTGSDEEAARFRIKQEKWGFGSCFTFSDNSTGKAVGTCVPCATWVTIQSLMDEIWLFYGSPKAPEIPTFRRHYK